MSRLSLPVLLAASLALAACATDPQTPSATPAASAAEPAYTTRNGQIDLALASGQYSCELGVNIKLEREYQDQVNSRIKLDWKGVQHRLERDPSRSGLPRFRDKGGRLVWVDLPWKGMLLDGRTNKPLANECRATQPAA
jgi:hypothetical protein